MNRSTVISMVQDLTEHKADQRLDFNNLFNLRLQKFIQKKPFWWRKKIFSFIAQPGVATYDLVNMAVPGSVNPLLNGGRFSGQVGAINVDGLWGVDVVPGAQVMMSGAAPADFNGGPFTLSPVSPEGLDVFYPQAGPDENFIGGSLTVIHPSLVLAPDLESFIKVEAWLNGQKMGCLEPDFDIEDISDQQENTVPGPPSTYCIEPGTSSVLRIMPAPDQAYKIKASYWACPQPADDFSDEKSDRNQVASAEYNESIEAAISRQDISAEKKLQFIVQEESVRSVVGGSSYGCQIADDMEGGFNQ